MEPYYQDPDITLYLGDMLTVLPTLGVEASAVITDPPYGISDTALQIGSRAGKRRGGDNTWHPPSDWDREFKPTWCMEAGRVAPLIVWFGQWRMRQFVEAVMPFPLRAEIVWAKDCHAGPPCPVAPRDERIWIFAKSGVNGRHFETSVWDEPVIPTWERKYHKNQKPIGLMRRLVRWATDHGDLVIDPFAGSGTTLRACKDLGRKAIGIELNEKHCEDAAKRLAQETLRLG